MDSTSIQRLRDAQAHLAAWAGRGGRSGDSTKDSRIRLAHQELAAVQSAGNRMCFDAAQQIGAAQQPG